MRYEVVLQPRDVTCIALVTLEGNLIPRLQRLHEPSTMGTGSLEHLHSGSV